MAKKEVVSQMFNRISKKYDFLNHVLSFGLDYLWRRRLIRLLIKDAPNSMLDVATGTGDLLILANNKHNFEKLVGLDISDGMLSYARKKTEARYPESIDKFTYILGPAERMPLESNSFDRISVGFGVRNFEDLEQGLREMCRVLKPGGSALVLEFSKPRSRVFGPIYNFYFKNILPIVGRLVSGDKEAYTYLFETVQNFPDYEQFGIVMDKAGFKDVKWRPLSLGICTIYSGTK